MKTSSYENMNHKTDKNKLEKHPLYPSCEWEGFYIYEGFEGKGKMDFYLEFSNREKADFSGDLVLMK